MTLAHELLGERTLWQKIFQTIKPLMQDTLTGAGNREGDLHWTEMRWDVADITVSWPKDKPTRNIHAWLRSPAWPRFYLEVEGAVWEDDEEKRERRLQLFAFPGSPVAIVISGLASDPVVAIQNEGELSERLIIFAKNLVQVRLGNRPSTHPLKPNRYGRVNRS